MFPSQKTSRIEELVLNLLIMFGIDHEYYNVDQHRDDREEDKFFEIGPLWVTLDAVLVHLKDKGRGVKHLFLSLDEDVQTYVLREIVLYALRLSNVLSIFQAQRDCRSNAATNIAPPFFP